MHTAPKGTHKITMLIYHQGIFGLLTQNVMYKLLAHK